MKKHELIEKVGGIEPEFKVGDLVVLGVGRRDVFKVTHNYHNYRLALESVVDFDITSSGLSNVRHATQSEIAAGHRIEPNTDDVTDIKYHVSPLTKVSCHHQWLSTDSLGCTEHHFICSYCSEKKTEAFGVNHESE